MILALCNNLDEILRQAQQGTHHVIRMNSALMGGGDESIRDHAYPATRDSQASPNGQQRRGFQVHRKRAQSAQLGEQLLVFPVEGIRPKREPREIAFSVLFQLPRFGPKGQGVTQVCE
jgi:hypothetical protein